MSDTFKRPRTRRNVEDSSVIDGASQSVPSQAGSSGSSFVGSRRSSATGNRRRSSGRRTGTIRSTTSTTSLSQILGLDCFETYKPTVRERLERNGVEFVLWDEISSTIKKSIMAVLDDTGSEEAISNSDQLSARAKQIVREAAGTSSEADLTTAISNEAFPRPNRSDELFPVGTLSSAMLGQVQNETFICGTAPYRRPSNVAPDDWYGIPCPRADLVLGYRWTGEVVDRMLEINRVFPTQTLNTAKGIFCGQIAVEFKSSFKGGTTAVAMHQVAGAAATMSHALGLLVDAAAAAQMDVPEQEQTPTSTQEQGKPSRGPMTEQEPD